MAQITITIPDADVRLDTDRNEAAKQLADAQQKLANAMVEVQRLTAALALAQKTISYGERQLMDHRESAKPPKVRG